MEKQPILALLKYSAKIMVGRLKVANDRMLDGASNNGNFLYSMISCFIFVILNLSIEELFFFFAFMFNNKKNADMYIAIVVPRISPLKLVIPINAINILMKA